MALKKVHKPHIPNAQETPVKKSKRNTQMQKREEKKKDLEEGHIRWRKNKREKKKRKGKTETEKGKLGMEKRRVIVGEGGRRKAHREQNWNFKIFSKFNGQIFFVNIIFLYYRFHSFSKCTIW